MRMIVGAACGLWVAVAGAVHAQSSAVSSRSEPVVVVELFTSQGCASCPPADEYLGMLAADPRIIPLALHVDYWDYIGWKDRFAKPQFTDRQKAYARAAGSRTIYTPQMIVGGKERVEGHQPEQLAMLVQTHLGAGQPVSLRLERSGDLLQIHAEADPPLTSAVRVQLVRYRPKETVDIETGENAGKTVTYRNIVTSWQIVGEWGGKAPLEMQAEAKGDEPVVVILQHEGPASILAAAVLR